MNQRSELQEEEEEEEESNINNLLVPTASSPPLIPLFLTLPSTLSVSVQLQKTKIRSASLSDFPLPL